MNTFTCLCCSATSLIRTSDIRLLGLFGLDFCIFYLTHMLRIYMLLHIIIICDDLFVFSDTERKQAEQRVAAQAAEG